MVSYSVLIITHGREELLMKCLDSLHSDSKEWQLILMANGMPLSESIIAKANSLTKHCTLLSSDIQMLPGRARNEAMKSAEGEWIFFIDDDSYVLPNYWETVFPLLENDKIDVLGGPDSAAKGMSALSFSLAIALSSPFCTGATFSRHKSLGKKLVHADEEKLTSCNLWVRRSAIAGISFPEEYKRAEENLFLQRLTAAGKGLYYHPKLKVAHFRRTSFITLFRPTYFSGYYRSRLLREKMTSGSEAFWLPSLFVLLHLLIFIEPIAFWSLVKLYVGIIFFVSFGLSVRAKKFWLFPLVGFLHYFIVFLYGIGFIAERLGVKHAQ